MRHSPQNRSEFARRAVSPHASRKAVSTCRLANPSACGEHPGKGNKGAQGGRSLRPFCRSARWPARFRSLGASRLPRRRFSKYTPTCLPSSTWMIRFYSGISGGLTGGAPSILRTSSPATSITTPSSRTPRPPAAVPSQSRIVPEQRERPHAGGWKPNLGHHRSPDFQLRMS